MVLWFLLLLLLISFADEKFCGSFFFRGFWVFNELELVKRWMEWIENLTGFERSKKFVRLKGNEEN